MKRSEINRAIEWAESLLAKNNIRLPRYAYWDMDKWAENKEEIDIIRQARLGWNVTDFGAGNFAETGAVLYTLRNGDPRDPSVGAPCCERYILMKEGQRLPKHYHLYKAGDIVNRAGGVLAIRLWNTDAAGNPLDAPVRAFMDGVAREFRPGEKILVYPGDSVSVSPRVAHTFGPEPGYGDLVIGEISKVSDDDADNSFLEPAARFAEIEEDEAVLRPLCGEYAKLI